MPRTYVLVFLYFDNRQRRLRSEKAVLLQRIYRGHLGRRRASRRREEMKLYLSLAPFAIRIQRNVRGYLCRIVHTKSSRLIREMYFNRKKEVGIIFCYSFFRCWYDLYCRPIVSRIFSLILVPQAESGLAVRLQAHARRYLAALRVSSWRELMSRRALNMDHAATTMQLLARMVKNYRICFGRHFLSLLLLSVRFESSR